MVDSYFCCGVNWHIGDFDDFGRSVNDLSNRESIDSSENMRREACFSLWDQMSIQMAPVSPELNRFTSKDTSLIDHIIVPHDLIPNCIKCKIQSTNDLIDKYGLSRLLGMRWKPPDHALITLSCSVDSSMMTDRKMKMKSLWILLWCYAWPFYVNPHIGMESLIDS